MERVDGYMKRAEDLKNVLESQNSSGPSKGGGGGGSGGITKRRTDGMSLFPSVLFLCCSLMTCSED